MLEKLNEVTKYIEEHITETICHDKLAKIACCSLHQFGRMFSYITGISLSEYIRRRKMSVAALDLQDSESKVSEIAIKYGYQSPTAFNRAFRSVHGIPPSAVWENKNFLTIYPRLRLKITLTGESEMQYRIEHKPEITIVGVKTKLTSNMEDNFELVPQFWKETMRTDIFHKLLGQTENQNENMIGVSVYHHGRFINFPQR